MKFACILTFIIIKTNVDQKNYYLNKHGRKKELEKLYFGMQGMLYYCYSTRNSWGTNQALASASLYLPPIKNIFSNAKQIEQKLQKPKFISIEMDGNPHPGGAHRCTFSILDIPQKK
jgi:hypothetical protein